MMARGPVEPVRMPPYHYQKQHVGGGGSASAEKGPAMTDPHKVAKPWRKVVKQGRLTRAYRGRNSARIVILECAHQVRLTGDRALTPPDRVLCKDCGQ